MLDEKTIRSLAAGIERARKTHELIRPVTAQFPEATIEDAYAIQRAWVAIRLAEVITRWLIICTRWSA